MIKIFKQIISWFLEPLHKPRSEVVETKPHRPPVRFQSIFEVEKTPSADQVGPEDFFSVVHNNKLYWTVFRCPCGCGEVISLPMREPHKPRWRLQRTKEARPDLKPSVWRNQGCMSHFWISDGRVYMCGDTGIAPWVANPAVYSKPKT